MDVQRYGPIIATSFITTAAAGFGIYYFYKKAHWNDEVKKRAQEICLIFDEKDCYIKDVAILTEKLKKMLRKGGDKVQIITDFDRTLTKYMEDGVKGYTTFQVIEKSSYMPSSLKEKLDALHRKYYPIEMSVKLTEEEKIPHMIEWYNFAFESIRKAGIQRHLIPDMVRESHVVVRDGLDQFFYLVTEKCIPLLIISAGIGDVLEEILHQHSKKPPHAEIIANYYSYGSDGLANGLQGDLIHTYNKKTVSERNKEYFDKVKVHSNVILLGDSLGDPAMADGMENINSIIKIGFLNHDVEEALPSYLQHYDIVLGNDAPLDTVNVLLHSLTKSL